MARTHQLILPPDTHANRPAASTLPSGALFSCTTHKKLERVSSDGTTWADFLDVSSLSVIPDVDLSTPATDGQALVFNAASGKWKAGSVAGGSSSSGSRFDNPSDSAWGASLGYDQELDTDTTSLPAGWSWVNQGSATFDQKYGAASISHPGAASDDVKALVRAVATESTWTLTVKCYAAGQDASSGAALLAGPVLRDSVSGKLLMLGNRQQSTVSGYYFTSATAFGSRIGAASDPSRTQFYPYLRIRKNSSTSYDFQVSVDGTVWWTYAAAVNITTQFTPDQMGFGVYRSGSVPLAASFHFFRVR